MDKIKTISKISITFGLFVAGLVVIYLVLTDPSTAKTFALALGGLCVAFSVGTWAKTYIQTIWNARKA